MAAAGREGDACREVKVPDREEGKHQTRRLSLGESDYSKHDVKILCDKNSLQ